MSESRRCQNTDRELWRERPGDYYADSLFVTERGGIGMNVGGFVIVKPIREWHRLAALAPAPDALRAALEPLAMRDCESWGCLGTPHGCAPQRAAALLAGDPNWRDVTGVRWTFSDVVASRAVLAAAPRGPEPTAAAIEAYWRAWATTGGKNDSQEAHLNGLRAAYAAQFGAAPGGSETP